MNDRPIQLRRGEFILSTDRARMEPGIILQLLHDTHWGGGLSLASLSLAMANSVCFGVFERDTLVGFGRAVTDLATYAYWTDVVVAETHRGRGLGRWLSECMLAHPELQGLRRVALLTRDAADLYAGLGFSVGPGSLIYMERRP
jgi:N-acetylglutamate synthase-like GNAT family acetyltransferase